jgi:hypothetical protein
VLNRIRAGFGPNSLAMAAVSFRLLPGFRVRFLLKARFLGGCTGNRRRSNRGSGSEGGRKKRPEEVGDVGHQLNDGKVGLWWKRELGADRMPGAWVSSGAFEVVPTRRKRSFLREWPLIREFVLRACKRLYTAQEKHRRADRLPGVQKPCGEFECGIPRAIPGLARPRIHQWVNIARTRPGPGKHRLSLGAQKPQDTSPLFFTARAYFDGLLDDVGHEGRIPHNGETVRTQRGLMLEKEPQDLREVMVFVRGTRHVVERCGECGSLAANIFAGPVFFRSGLDGRL